MTIRRGLNLVVLCLGFTFVAFQTEIATEGFRISPAFHLYLSSVFLVTFALLAFSLVLKFHADTLLVLIGNGLAVFVFRGLRPDRIFASEDSAAWLNLAGRTFQPRTFSRFSESGPATFAFVFLGRFTPFQSSNEIVNPSIDAVIGTWWIAVTLALLSSLIIGCCVKSMTRSRSVTSLSAHSFFASLLIFMINLMMTQFFFDRGWLSACISAMLLQVAVGMSLLAGPLCKSLALCFVGLAVLSWWPLIIVFFLIFIRELYLFLCPRTITSFNFQNKGSLILLCGLGASLFSSVISVNQTLASLISGRVLGVAFNAPTVRLPSTSVDLLFVFLASISSVVSFYGPRNFQSSLASATLLPFLFLGVLLIFRSEWVAYGLSKLYVVLVPSAVAIFLTTLLNFILRRSRHLTSLNLKISARYLTVIFIVILSSFLMAQRKHGSSVSKHEVPLWAQVLQDSKPAGVNLCFLPQAASPGAESYVCSRFWSSTTGTWSIDTADWAQGLIEANEEVLERDGLRRVVNDRKTVFWIGEPTDLTIKTSLDDFQEIVRRSPSVRVLQIPNEPVQ